MRSWALLLLFLFSAQSKTPFIEGKFLKRGELPEDFRFPVLELEFAVLKIKIENRSPEALTLRPSELEVKDPKGKPIPKAAPVEITPKIMGSKAFRRSSRDIHGDARMGYPPVYYPPYSGRSSVPITQPGSGSGTVSVDTASKIRAVLEQHELKETTLAPGRSLEALVYFKSKKSPSELAGSTVLIGNSLKVRIPATP